MMSYAQAAALALTEAMQADERIVVMGEDIGRGGIFAQYSGLLQAFGAQRIFDTPISEATIMGAGVGMALAGLKPVVELRLTDFALCAADEIVNQAAKNRYMFGGQRTVPVLIRMPMGIWDSSAAQHSQSLESWFAHLPGVVVLAPATPQDNYGMLKAALACEDPVIYLEHKMLWASTGDVTPGYIAELGKAHTVRSGEALTMVSWSRQLLDCIEACKALSTQGIEVDLIDLRSIWPWDRDALLASCRRTGHLLVVHEAVQAAGFGAEIVATVAEALPCRVARLGAPRIPVGYAPTLELQARVTTAQIESAARQLLATAPSQTA